MCLAGLTAAAVCGCGGSSSGPSTAATAPIAPGTTAPIASGTTAPIAPAPAGTSGSALAGGLPGASGATGATTPTAPPSPARARFITQADRVCLTTDNELEVAQAKVDTAVKAEQKKSTTGHRKALAAGMRGETSLAKTELTRLRALRPPAADRAVVAKYLAAVASQVQLVDQFAKAVDDDDAAGVTTTSAKLTLGETTVDDLAGAYGFKVCGSTASASP
ncbi:MAG TPA: hypothetical protein VHW26_07030 [Solirubrobacteraceae bacterium]|nr:hypothetical protein [Solirubrobacteraceae bacterium]